MLTETLYFLGAMVSYGLIMYFFIGPMEHKDEKKHATVDKIREEEKEKN